MSNTRTMMCDDDLVEITIWGMLTNIFLGPFYLYINFDPHIGQVSTSLVKCEMK